MFITSHSGYNRAGEQTAAGLFLILMDRRAVRSVDAPLRAVVRSVRMRQVGHFMMGTAQIGPERVTLSGAYGSDGLPCDVSDAAFERGLQLPDELFQAWSKGGGWNSAGSEAPAMRQWALDNLAVLRGQKPVASA